MSTGAVRSDRGPDLFLAAALAVATLALFAPVAGFSFLGYDDEPVLLVNSHVRGGLSWESVRWALTTTHLGNWIPVTWLSHLADVSLFGLRPGPPHLVNAAIHALAAALFFLFLRRATGARWRSAAVAALFAVHPLHVESVAWVTLRRDVLMGLFCALALLAWDRWVRSRSARWYALALALFGLGLMAKALLVAFPVLLIALDWWPYGRDAGASPGRRAGRLLLEKAPFAALAAVASALAFHAQTGSMVSASQLPLVYRVMNAASSFGWYLAKALWPTKLAIFYPHAQRGQSVPEAVLALLVLVALVAVAALWRRRLPWLGAALLWYVAGLLPVIGIVQVGGQARADRYSYLPLIGAFWAAAWSLDALARRFPALRRGLGAASLAAIAAYAAVASVQLRTWRDDFTVFGHAVAVTRGNYVAETNLGRAYLDAGREEEAIPHLEEALRVLPGFPEAHNNLGVAAMRQGRLEEAERQFRAGIARYAGLGFLHRNLGILLARTGRPGEALASLGRALRLDPDDALALMWVGILLARRGELAPAEASLARAARLDPRNGPMRFNHGKVLTEAGRLEEGERELREAQRLVPADGDVANTLGQNLAAQGRVAEAALWFERAVALDGGSGAARANLERARALLAPPPAVPAGEGTDPARERPK